MEYYLYVSSKATCDPCRTIFLCAPGHAAATEHEVKAFAKESGWLDLAEEQEAVLVAPLAPQGWEQESLDSLKQLYGALRNSVTTRSGIAIWGRSGKLWLWETLLYLVGYGDGADYAGNVLLKHPNQFAATALIGGLPSDFSQGDLPSDHFMTMGVSRDYAVKNRDIPMQLWLFPKEGCRVEALCTYVNRTNLADRTEQVRMDSTDGSMTGIRYYNAQHPAQELRVYSGADSCPDRTLSSFIMGRCFSHAIRWKNGPDGTLAYGDSKESFYQNPRFLRRTVTVGAFSYDYFVHLPKGMNKADVKGLPLVFTVHGRGEPAWLFTEKNGWDTLGDQTRDFVLVSPDSPGNIWFLPRDGEAFPAMIQAMAEEFEIDLSRVYLTGFSNGAMITREVALKYPTLFAAISPWNGPSGDTAFMMREDSNQMPHKLEANLQALLDDFQREGYELPCAFCFGDQDPGIPRAEDLFIAPFIRANHCDPKAKFGSLSKVKKDRFRSEYYYNAEGVPMVTVTTMKNMPHGAIPEESEAVWNYLKQFKRSPGEKKIEVLK